MMTDITERLTSLKKTIDLASTNVASDEGELKVWEKQMKDEFGNNSLEDAEKQLIKIDKGIETDEATLEKGTFELEKKIEKIEENG